MDQGPENVSATYRHKCLPFRSAHFPAVRRKGAWPKVGPPHEAENVGLVQGGVAEGGDHLCMHLRIFRPVHVAVHVVDGVVAVVAGQPVDDGPHKVTG